MLTNHFSIIDPVSGCLCFVKKDFTFYMKNVVLKFFLQFLFENLKLLQMEDELPIWLFGWPEP